ncbi:MAG: alpha-ketoglutarate-dependent dioxygenase AlkB [Thiotrichaceae bacterium]
MLDLFTTKETNLLPCDGEAYYSPAVVPRDETNDHLNCLLRNISWKQDEVFLYGKHITTQREMAWYGDKRYVYHYSNTTKHALLWTKELLPLKAIVEKETKTVFNSCLLNLYHSGNEGMGWHSDDEASLERYGMIASLSLGAERDFVFKHKKTGQKVSILLEQGSVLRMQGRTQDHWLHALPKTTKISTPRINLTFRKMRG